jgi:hypothetical protein
MIASAINDRMQRKLDYSQEEVRVLLEILAALTGNGRLSFDNGAGDKIAYRSRLGGLRDYYNREAA